MNRERKDILEIRVKYDEDQPPVLSVLVKVRHVKAQGDEFVQRGWFRFVRRYKGACTILAALSCNAAN
ncbi:Uncharacterized protein HZ326_7663 [Fusarium oxysporum f. sp. albedinis]|nr:Uncharacterized protein HZ326_7663 [Fusarium oxysporum f. sp. albedinis]